MARRKRRRRPETHLGVSPKGQHNLVYRPDNYTCCPTGKIVHPSRATARRQVKSILGAGGEKNGHGTLGAYQCSVCGKWHVGHRVAEEQRSNR